MVIFSRNSHSIQEARRKIFAQQCNKWYIKDKHHGKQSLYIGGNFLRWPSLQVTKKLPIDEKIFSCIHHQNLVLGQFCKHLKSINNYILSESRLLSKWVLQNLFHSEKSISCNYYINYIKYIIVILFLNYILPISQIPEKFQMD